MMTDETMKDGERAALYTMDQMRDYALAFHEVRAAALQAGLTDEQIESLWYCHMGHSISSGRMVAKAISFARALLTQAGLDKPKEI